MSTNLVFTFDEAVYFTSEGPELSVDVFRLPSDVSVSLRLPSVEDRSGNLRSFEGMSFSTSGVFVDSIAPVATSARTLDIGAFRAGDEIAFSIRFNEPVRL